jgi:hypothetical protein
MDDSFFEFCWTLLAEEKSLPVQPVTGRMDRVTGRAQVSELINNLTKPTTRAYDLICKVTNRLF